MIYHTEKSLKQKLEMNCSAGRSISEAGRGYRTPESMFDSTASSIIRSFQTAVEWFLWIRGN